MNTKICKKCNIEKPLTDFYRHNGTADGYLNICKNCKKEDGKKYRKENIEKVREYDRNRPNKEERVEKHRKRIEKMKKDNPTKYRKYLKSAKKWNEQNKEKRNAHNKVARALMNGKLIRKSKCEKCSSIEKIEAHHENYSKPLEVIWLCEKCHKDIHREKREGGY